MPRLCPPFLVLFLAAALDATAGWRAGVAKTNITPIEPIWMAGYAARTRPSEGVYAPLYVKALALEERPGDAYVLVTADLAGFTRSVSDAIFAEAMDRFALPRRRLVLNASHTHSGPLAGQIGRPSYRLGAAEAAVVARYTDRLVGQVVETVGRALADLAPAELSFEQGYAGFAVNRRRVGARERPGPVDHDVPALAVRAADGALRAVVFGYSCHATVMADYEIHGDWPGFAQTELERRYPSAAALFLNGCGADQNPLPRRRIELARSYGAILAEAVAQVVDGKMKPLPAPLVGDYRTTRLDFQPPPSRQEFERRLREGDPAQRANAEAMLAELAREGKLPSGYDYPVRAWRFGNALTVVFLAGEVVVDYSLEIRRWLGWETTWVSGYNDDVFAYIPTARIVAEGGYEGETSMLGYGWPAPFEPSVEQRVLKAVGEAAAAVGAAE